MTSPQEAAWTTRLALLESRLAPIATRKVDIDKPDWVEALRAVKPLDEAGFREDAHDLLEELIAAYATGDADRRTLIRDLFRRHRSFAWATTLRVPRTTAEGLRAHLLLFSVRDQGADPRDAKLWLDDILDEGRRAGVDLEPALREVAALSSREAPYSWGSTHKWLMDRMTAR